MKSLLVILTVAALIALGVTITGVITMTLWEWFITPTFGLAPLSFGAALGVAMVVGYLVPNTNPYKDKKPEAQVIAVLSMRPAIYLVLGYITVHWIGI